MAKKSSCISILGAAAGLLAAGGAFYTLYVRPKIVQRWGATGAEVAASMPGDELVPGARLVSTRAISIQASPEQVWAWLVQIGYGRAGWYSYDALEQAAGVAEFATGETSAGRILPEFQQLQPGDRVLTHPDGGFYVDQVQPARLLVLSTQIDPLTGQTTPLGQPVQGPVCATSWVFSIQPAASGGSRLVVRFRCDYTPEVWLRIASPVVLEPVVFLMEQKMLRGIRTRAEGMSTD